MNQPMTIERHDAPCAVLLSLDEFRRYRALEQRSFHPSELDEESFAALKATRDELARFCDLAD